MVYTQKLISIEIILQYILEIMHHEQLTLVQKKTLLSRLKRLFKSGAHPT